LSDLPRLLLCSFDVIPGPSGSSRRLTEYLKALPDRFSVVVLSAKTPDHSHIEKYQGARLLRVPVGSGDLASRIQSFERAVRRQLESEDYALAHFTDPFGGYALCELKGDYGYRLIYEAQTFPSQELRYTHPQTDGDRRFLSKIRRQELFCLMNADLVVTGSQTTRAYIQGLGAAEDQLRTIRAPVDLKPYDPEVLGAPDGSPLRMMYLGSHVGWQGLPTLLRATALAAQQVDVRLTLVGAHHPDWKPHLEDLVNDLGLKEKVDFQPPVIHDDLVKVLALADVGVLPLDDSERNRLQGGPLAKVSEYLAAGRPVIAADLPVTRELVPRDAAVFFPPGDAKALSERILDLARDVPRRVAMGKAGRAFAEKVLDAGRIRGQLLDLYDSLLEKRGHVPVEAASEPPDVTMTGTPTNRLASLGMPEASQPAVSKPPAKPAAQAEPAPAKEAAEELPLVVGMALEEGLDTRLVKTEPDLRPDEVPMVLGLPLREPTAPAPAPEPPARTTEDTSRTAAPPAKEAEPEPLGGRSNEPSPPTEMVTHFTARSLATQDADDARSSERDDGAAASRAKSEARDPKGEDEAPAPAVRRPASSDSEEDASEHPGRTAVVRSPLVDEELRIARRAAAAGDDRSASDSRRPGGDEERSASDSRRSVGDEERSASDSRRSVGDEERSASDSRRSVGDEERSASDSRRSVGDEERSASSEPRRSRDDERPASEPPRSGGGDERSPSSPRQASSDEERAGTDPTPVTRRPSGDDVSTSDRTPISRRPSGDDTSTSDRTPISRRPSGDDASASDHTPISRRPSGDHGSVPDPTPIVRRSSGDDASPSDPTPISRRPSGDDASVPDPTPIVRRSSGDDASPSDPTPISRRSSALEEEASAPTPIVRRPAVLAEDAQEPPSPTPIVPMKSVLNGSRGIAAGRPQRPGSPSEPSSSEPPRLFPSPMADADKPPLRGGAAADPGRPSSRSLVTPESDSRTPPLPPRASAPPSATRQGPPPRLSPTPPMLKPSATGATDDDEPEEIDGDEAESLDDEPVLTPSRAGAALLEADEIGDDEVHDADAMDVQDADEAVDEGPAPAPPASSLDPWFAQLAHGYCPPEGTHFARHTPPTNFPGRDLDPGASPGSPPPVGQGAVRGKNS
jgi:glycosyltransferase involved in cell wall biosynthesis